MDRQGLKKFAIWSHDKLRAQVAEIAKLYPVRFAEEMRLLDKSDEDYIEGDENCIRRIIYFDDKLVEKTAFSLFYRLCVLRYLEVNGIVLPDGFRVFSEEGKEEQYNPFVLGASIAKHRHMPPFDDGPYMSFKKLKDYPFWLISMFDYLEYVMPSAFGPFRDELNLMPDTFNKEDSFIEHLVSDIAVDDWREGVEIIGWLYQYYFDEAHEAVIDPLASKTIAKEDIPVATQVFTTDWVVQYMVDNSLGRYWIERSPNSQLRKLLPFYVTDDNAGADISNDNHSIRPESIKFLDPCMGCGHILVYAFDVLMAIYRECGYSDVDAVRSIFEHNLYGFDIDERVVRVGGFAVLMKAYRYDNEVVKRKIAPKFYAFRESTDLEIRAQSGASMHRYVVGLFANAKSFGALIDVGPKDYDAYIDHLEYCFNRESDDPIIKGNRRAYKTLMVLARQAKLLNDKYTIVCTNPPYMNKYDPDMKSFLTENYKGYAGDLFSAFIYRNLQLCEPQGYCAYMTPNVWMFIKTYKKLRDYIIKNKHIVTLIQMAKGAFFNDATVDICAFVLKNGRSNGDGVYYRLEDFRGNMDVQKAKVLEALADPNCGYIYKRDQSEFELIPNSPLAYWIEPELARAFRCARQLSCDGTPRQGLATTDNKRFLRRWYEVDFDQIAFHCACCDEAQQTHKKWFPYNKGGEFRKWYGNADYIVDYENNGEEIIANVMRKYPYLNTPWYVVKNTEYYFKPSISWSKISSGCAAFRHYPQGFIFDVSGCSIFYDDDAVRLYHFGLLNSKVTQMIFEAISPTLNYEVGHIANLPVFEPKSNAEAVRQRVATCVEDNIALSKSDWGSFETSWDFKKHPLVDGVNSKGTLIANVYDSWKKACEARFNALKANEEELNRIFIDIYGLNGSLSPDVCDKYVSVHRVFDARQDVPPSMKGSTYIRTMRDEIVSLISYAVGCMFGRYRLDKDGVNMVGNSDAQSHERWYAVDNYIPVSATDSFDDDIATRFFGFIETVYGASALDENLTFIAHALGGQGAPRQVIRDYFATNFYADHVKLYDKRPIYWLFDSGKHGDFGVLVSMHRYRPCVFESICSRYIGDLMARTLVRIDEARDREAAAMADKILKRPKTPKSSQRQPSSKALAKRIEALKSFEELLRRFGAESIEIDLNDGVVANVAKFSGALVVG